MRESPTLVMATKAEAVLGATPAERPLQISTATIERHTLKQGTRLIACKEMLVPTLVEDLSARARALPREDRARLAEELLASLDEGADEDADEAWQREIERRVFEVRSGSVTLVSAEDVHEEARRLIRR